MKWGKDLIRTSICPLCKETHQGWREAREGLRHPIRMLARGRGGHIKGRRQPAQIFFSSGPPRQNCDKERRKGLGATHSISWRGVALKRERTQKVGTRYDTVVKTACLIGKDFVPNELHMFLTLLEHISRPKGVCLVHQTLCRGLRWAGRGICQAPLKFEPLLARGELQPLHGLFKCCYR